MEYKGAILFLVKYVLVYLVLNTVYAWYVSYNAPDADPVTVAVSKHVAFLLQLQDRTVSYSVVAGSASVPVSRADRVVVEVFEGCNSLNVMIVFAAFLIAFKGPLKATLTYLSAGLIVIYVFNLVRVMGLYGVALHFPDSLYFFHKFFFTGFIYGIVFLIWFLWVKAVSRWRIARQ